MSRRSSSLHRKRRRSSSTSRLPSDSINPLSHRPSTLKQFAVAGLPETEDLPSHIVPGFPHKPFPKAQQLTSFPSGNRDDEGNAAAADGEGEQDHSEGLHGVPESAVGQSERRAKGLLRERRLRDRKVGVVEAILHRSLAEGNISRAKAAFAQLLRATVHGKRVDLRHGGCWALGAEILMRDGEGVTSTTEPSGSPPAMLGTEGEHEDELVLPAKKRWGAAANMPRLKAYLEDLIQLHPYDRNHPGSLSALDFWPVMLTSEIYNVYIEHKLALERLENGSDNDNNDAQAQDWEEDDSGNDAMDIDGDASLRTDYLPSKREVSHVDERHDSGHPFRRHHSEPRLRERKDELRLRALEEMRDIVGRMDAVMENPPYSASIEMLRLRGMAALYMGDLVLPPNPRTAEEDAEGRVRREEERRRAVTMFRRLEERGGEIEDCFQTLVRLVRQDEDDVDDEEYPSEALPMYSSLPLRPS
ncbi:hypothetical protein VTK73DRAFT_6954 [Phialemonium thermophilum]|uniref:Uncharacterized protein n=1 Tax=Phialemonium thermophilum TaxID=223376 RepID=A0ABR3XTV2_9PEZI